MSQLHFFADPTVRRMGEVDYLKRSLMAAREVQFESDGQRQLELIATGIAHLHGADVVHAYELDDDGRPQLTLSAGEPELPAVASDMERALLPRAFAKKRSLLSTHPRLSFSLQPLADECTRQGVTTEVLLVRARKQNHGAFVAHWLGRERPERYEQRSAFWTYWDQVGFAVAATRAEAKLRKLAYYDILTGLPNRLSLDEELARVGHRTPLSVLVLDFDGMREANAAFGYDLGGDVLIAAVGGGLREHAREHEFAARLNKAGDEFALVLPGVGEDAARLRAAEVEAYLDALPVPETHRSVYNGASVGFATRTPGELMDQMLRRAEIAMVARKRERCGDR